MNILVSLTAVGLLFTINVHCITDGSKFIGLGYNVLFGNPDGGDLSHTGVDVGIKGTRHILRLTPETEKNLIVTDVKTTCLPHNTTAVFYGPKSYQDYLLGDVVTTGPGNDAVMPYAFTKSTVYQDIAHRTTKNHDVFRDSLTICNKGKTRYVMPPSYLDQHDVTNEFATAVCNLPTVYDKDAYRQFLDTWGTHVIIGVEVGTKNIARYEQSIAELAKILLSYDIGVGSVTVENYMGYGTVIHLNVSNLHHDDYFRITGGTLDSTLTVGTIAAPEPVAYKLATIASFMDENYWHNVVTNDLSDGCAGHLSQWKNNTIQALMDYAELNGMQASPSDPKIKLPVTWPHGTYGLYKPNSGCPTSPIGWAEGWRRQDAEDHDNSNTWSPGIHLAGSIGYGKPVFYFCIKTADENSEYEVAWPQGNYCILKKGSCPQGFSQGEIHWDDEDHDNANGLGGTLPDGKFGSDTNIEFCCRSDGAYNKKILLPVDKPFYLLRYASPCQEVFGMTVREEVVKMDTEDHDNQDKCYGAHPYNPRCGRDHELHYCYYERKPANSFPSVIFG